MAGRTPKHKHPEAGTEWWDITHQRAAAAATEEPELFAKLLAEYRAATTQEEADIPACRIEDEANRVLIAAERRSWRKQ